eukprot:GFUD01009513.1.p1 GENE.GFUD01009513.1~~GFUD01009513.1.p1  ORF type:complete len:340 (+),score=133.14 GFUD01009513.1:50-1069(+)
MGMEEKLDKKAPLAARQEEDFIAVATRNEAERKMKVPGQVHPIGKMSFEVIKLRAELKSKTVPQLKEVLERQEKILGNKSLVKRLPDKGERAKSTKDMVIQLLKDKEEVRGLDEEMKNLKINTDAMEWKNRLLDSDDDSDPEADGPLKNPLEVLAQGVVPAKSSKGKLEEEESQNEERELYARKDTEKVDNTHTKDKFAPFSSARTTCLDGDLRSQLGEGATKAKPSGSRTSPHPHTPSIPLPPVYNCQTRQLTLAESLTLQQNQDRRLRDMQLKHASEKLAASKGVARLGLQDIVGKGQFEEYRNTNEDSGGEEDVDSGDEGVGVVGMQQLTENNDEN